MRLFFHSSLRRPGWETVSGFPFHGFALGSMGPTPSQDSVVTLGLVSIVLILWDYACLSASLNSISQFAYSPNHDSSLDIVLLESTFES